MPKIVNCCCAVNFFNNFLYTLNLRSHLIFSITGSHVSNLQKAIPSIIVIAAAIKSKTKATGLSKLILKYNKPSVPKTNRVSIWVSAPSNETLTSLMVFLRFRYNILPGYSPKRLGVTNEKAIPPR